LNDDNEEQHSDVNDRFHMERRQIIEERVSFHWWIWIAGCSKDTNDILEILKLVFNKEFWKIQ
jgi:hypothetical protein